MDDDDHLDEIIKRSARDGIWITRESEVMHISEMEDRHIFYAEQLLREWKKKEVRPSVRMDLSSWINRFTKEQSRRKRKAQRKKIPSRKLSRGAHSPGGKPPKSRWPQRARSEA